MNYAPELVVQEWLNTKEELTLKSLRGRVVLIEAFQMLCPGCVAHALPQAQEVATTFPNDKVVVLGLHTVFEHHEAQGSRVALAAFLHEYRLTFPVAIDAPSTGGTPIPQTMAAYEMRGTPTTILIDKSGTLRMNKFGRERDMVLGARIASLLLGPETTGEGKQACDADGCLID
tara:strand:- start:120197 stop:120718 length:522 start_codon:yes stop_codon:yes gene_type:complete